MGNAMIRSVRTYIYIHTTAGLHKCFSFFFSMGIKQRERTGTELVCG